MTTSSQEESTLFYTKCEEIHNRTRLIGFGLVKPKYIRRMSSRCEIEKVLYREGCSGWSSFLLFRGWYNRMIGNSLNHLFRIKFPNRFCCFTSISTSLILNFVNPNFCNFVTRVGNSLVNPNSDMSCLKSS